MQLLLALAHQQIKTGWTSSRGPCECYAQLCRELELDALYGKIQARGLLSKAKQALTALGLRGACILQRKNFSSTGTPHAQLARNPADLAELIGVLAVRSSFWRVRHPTSHGFRKSPAALATS